MFFIAYLIVGCGKNEPSEQILYGKQLLEGFVGDWEQSCKIYQKNQSIKTTMGITTDNISIRKDFYSDKECIKINHSFLYISDFKEVKMYRNSTLDIDFQLSSYFLILFDKNDVDSYNIDKNYGYNDWSLGVSKDIIGRINRNGKVVESGKVGLNIIREFDDGFLYGLGNEVLPSERPRSYDKLYPFTKIK